MNGVRKSVQDMEQKVRNMDKKVSKEIKIFGEKRAPIEILEMKCSSTN